MPTPAITFEFYNGTSWADITAHVITGSAQGSGGLKGANPTDRIAVPGTFTCQMNNSPMVSGSLKLGYYSPDHANVRTGWVIGAKIRVKLVSGGNTRYWMYRIKDIDPVAGQYGSRRVKVTATDYMHEFSERKVTALGIQTNRRGDQLVTTLVASMPIAPINTDYDTGAFYFPYAFHNEQDENTFAMTVLQEIAQSELSYIYVDGDSTDGETLHYESHTTRMNNVTSAATLDDAMVELNLGRSRDNIFNYFRGVTYPVNTDTEISVLGTIPEEFALGPGESRTVTLRYIDENTGRRISGTSIQTPEADTDYKMTAISGSGGNELNAYITVVPTAGANTLSAVVTNTHSGWAYVSFFQIRGYKVTLYDKVESIDSDSTSILAYGEKSITFNMPYQNNANFAVAVNAELKRRYKDPRTNVRGVTFDANKSATLMGYALTKGIGTRVTITETATGIDLDFYINGFEYKLLEGGILKMTWILEPAFNDTRYFTVGDPTYGVIGGAYVIAPF